MNEHLQWRYTTKKFDPSKKIPDTDFQSLLEVLRLAPSSYGLQPWKFVVIRDQRLREQLKDFAWGQSQITEASHLIIFCAVTNIDAMYLDRYINRVAEVRGVSLGSLEGYRKGISQFINSQSSQALLEWTKRQVYIPLGIFLSECARQKIDVCPMEGFDVVKTDSLLNLHSESVTAIALCAIGYRSMDDKYSSLKKVRFDLKDVFIDR